MTIAQFIANYWPLLAIVSAVALALFWFLLRLNRKTSVVRESLVKDVLDEGAAKASRNQALIDAEKPAETVKVPIPDLPSSGDDLTQIKGLGPKIAAMLNAQGINRFADVASWTDSDIDRIDAQLGKFQGRIRRDNWVEQAKLLNSKDESDFASKYGQNG